MKAQISQQGAITNFLNKCNNNSKPTMINHQYKPKLDGNKIALICLLVGFLVYLIWIAKDYLWMMV